MAKSKSDKIEASMQKEIDELRKQREHFEKKTKLMKELEIEKISQKKAFKEMKHYKRDERIRKLESGLRKAFLITEKGAKKLEKFMKEDHL